MASMTALSTGVQSVTATGAVTPTAGIDISGITGDATLCVEVVGFDAAQTARIQVEDTVNAFTASIAAWVQDVTGQIGVGPFTAGVYNPTTAKYSIRKYQLPNVRFGTTSAKLRVNVTAISGGTLSLNAWLEQ